MIYSCSEQPITAILKVWFIHLFVSLFFKWTVAVITNFDLSFTHALNWKNRPSNCLRTFKKCLEWKLRHV